MRKRLIGNGSFFGKRKEKKNPSTRAHPIYRSSAVVRKIDWHLRATSLGSDEDGLTGRCGKAARMPSSKSIG